MISKSGKGPDASPDLIPPTKSANEKRPCERRPAPPNANHNYVADGFGWILCRACVAFRGYVLGIAGRTRCTTGALFASA